MANVKSEKIEKLEVIKIFNFEVEKKNYDDVQELFLLLKKCFNNKNKEFLEVGKISYFILGLKKEKLVNYSYINIANIVNKFLELNGIISNTTDKCIAWYNNKLNKNIVNYKEDFKNSGRKKEVLNLDNIKL